MRRRLYHDINYIDVENETEVYTNQRSSNCNFLSFLEYNISITVLKISTLFGRCS